MLKRSCWQWPVLASCTRLPHKSIVMSCSERTQSKSPMRVSQAVSNQQQIAANHKANNLNNRPRQDKPLLITTAECCAPMGRKGQKQIQQMTMQQPPCLLTSWHWLEASDNSDDGLYRAYHPAEASKMHTKGYQHSLRDLQLSSETRNDFLILVQLNV